MVQGEIDTNGRVQLSGVILTAAGLGPGPVEITAHDGEITISRIEDEPASPGAPTLTHEQINEAMRQAGH